MNDINSLNTYFRAEAGNVTARKRSLGQGNLVPVSVILFIGAVYPSMHKGEDVNPSKHLGRAVCEQGWDAWTEDGVDREYG